MTSGYTLIDIAKPSPKTENPRVFVGHIVHEKPFQILVVNLLIGSLVIRGVKFGGNSASS